MKLFYVCLSGAFRSVSSFICPVFMPRRERGQRESVGVVGFLFRTRERIIYFFGHSPLTLRVLCIETDRKRSQSECVGMCQQCVS